MAETLVAKQRRWREAVWIGTLGVAFLGVTVSVGTINTTVNDFFNAGSQPLEIEEVFYSSQDCVGCHGYLDLETEPFRPWAASMMGQAARDPVFHAALAVANQDASFAGDMCIRCHSPGGWLEGRSEPPDGSALMGADFDGVSCHFCHRMVDPDHTPGVDPAIDATILAGLVAPPDAVHGIHNGAFVVDPLDRRRGPFDIGGGHFHEALESPFHTDSRMCATCHDVSNPMLSRQPDGSYALNALDQAHPTGDKFDQFPIERTFSEWAMSEFAQGPIDMGGRFGGNNPLISSCQDCHMQDVTGQGCITAPVRDNLPAHYFNGGNTWVLKAIRNLYDDLDTYLSDDSVNASIARAVAMLQNASDMELTVQSGQLRVRIINQSGHKLPTGYPEGRRMWVNVRFRDGQGNLIAERGHYDPATATLTTADTKVYQAKLGLDAAMAAASGVPEGPSFHFVLNNKIYADNRIPPRGFTNAAFEAVQAAPVNYTYADGQYWDDTLYAIPAGAASADVSVFYQTTSKEYIEFLRDQNTTNTAGQTAYDQWAATGKSEPVEMDAGTLTFCRADFDGSGTLTLADFVGFRNAYVSGNLLADFDGSGTLTLNDFIQYRNAYVAGCP